MWQSYPHALSHEGRAPHVGALLVSVACAYFGVAAERDVFRKARTPAVSKARWAISMVLYLDIGWGKKRIAKFLIKDKKAIHHGIARAHELYRSSASFFSGVELLRREVFQ